MPMWVENRHFAVRKKMRTRKYDLSSTHLTIVLCIFLAVYIIVSQQYRKLFFAVFPKQVG